MNTLISPLSRQNSQQQRHHAASQTQHLGAQSDPITPSEFPLEETHCFSQMESCRTLRTSAGRNWNNVYISKQIEDPNEGTFQASPHLLISLTRSGSTRVICDVQSQEFRAYLHPGQLCILAPNQPVRLKWDRRVHTTHLYLRSSLLNEVAGDITRNQFTSVDVVGRLAFMDPLLEGLVTAVDDAMELEIEGARSYVEHLARAAACHVLRKYSALHSPQVLEDASGELTKSQLARFREMVETRMSQKLTLTDLAEGSGLSTGHFAHLYKQATGKTPYQYLLHSRIDRARYLLAKTTMPVARIAAECGFSDHVHFTRVFSKTVGQPPAAFRKIAAD
ncbi:AraC family transcriptional regulator [Mesorhizobium sp. VK25A]|uniref:AraC family transcriptional regulator n=1 Tax=Mesorhizobium vachelliae TaxID=3072309 RepID=A0ABU5A8E4_9HYPH|nr:MULTISPECIES: AraC family transcriptional regulator [unclassified Mesorhizobium]MDX8532466.1 AraC family transcriptional regulator [Mesorhizobium sp. VK25D]MDX8547888.1 AraC family transcriptional regulator [Mesorhizobium sp. VK25A]